MKAPKPVRVKKPKDAQTGSLLLSTKERLAAIVESCHDAIVSYDLEGNIISWNAAAERLYGYLASEILGQSGDVLTWPDRPEGFTGVLQRIVLGDQVQRYETMRKRKDGYPVHVAVTASPIKDSEGQVIGVSGISTDISERVRLEQARDRAEAQLHSIADSVSDAIVAANSQGQVIAWNRGAESMFGYASEEIIGQPLTTIMPERYRDADEAGIKRVASGEQPRLGNHLSGMNGLRKDGSEVPIDLSLGTWEVDGQIYFSGIMRDVSERALAEKRQRDLEEQLAQSQKLDAIGRLAGGVAHDFNNIVTVIGAHAELLREAVPEEASVLEDVREILSATERAGKLTRSLLAYSRRQVLRLEPTDVTGTVTSVMQMVRRIIGEDVHLKLELDPCAGTVVGDETQLERVLVNLIVNARQAMPQGGELRISTSHVDLDETFIGRDAAFEPGGFVRLRIADTGVGMDEETVAHIFEPFFTTKNRSEASGLGLSTVYGIVKQLGGYVTVVTEPGRGSEFSLYLPRTDAPAAPERGERRARAAGGDETVLFIEDDPALRNVAETILTREGYRVLVAADGEEALRTLSDPELHVDVVVCDVVLPGMNGVEVVKSLCTSRPLLRAVYVTGYTPQEIARRGLTRTDVTLLDKPFTTESLLRSVRYALDTVVAAPGA